MPWKSITLLFGPETSSADTVHVQLRAGLFAGTGSEQEPVLQQDRHTDGQITPFQGWAQQYITYAGGEVCEVGHKGSRGGGNGAEVLRIRRSSPDRKQGGTRVSKEPRGSTPVSSGGADSCDRRAVLLFLSAPAIPTYSSVKC